MQPLFTRNWRLRMQSMVHRRLKSVARSKFASKSESGDVLTPKCSSEQTFPLRSVLLPEQRAIPAGRNSRDAPVSRLDARMSEAAQGGFTDG